MERFEDRWIRFRSRKEFERQARDVWGDTVVFTESYCGDVIYARIPPGTIVGTFSASKGNWLMAPRGK